MSKEKLFYANGLRFSCKQCSLCCRQDPGYVFLTEDDVSMLFNYLKMSKDDFILTYCRWIKISLSIEYLSLKETSNYDCFFWKNGCSVYDARPVQCKTYPFWSEFVEDEETWLQTECPGINEGELNSAEYIEKCISTKGAIISRLVNNDQ
ncbi:MAG: YkgJ family cysteine cluster protein [Spirochaetaceae bacterium]|jgi:Fe-S-cluster containining protein|nr:YkgJ family cysteine cluster protein [Spirochaetaceae bacterium]